MDEPNADPPRLSVVPDESTSDPPAETRTASEQTQFQPRVPVSEHKTIVERHKRGESLREIAADYPVGPARIGQIIRKATAPRYGATSLDPGARARSLANLRPAPPVPELGNTRRMVHGLRSPRVMAPYQAAAEAWALARWPNVDETRRHMVADLAADIERVREWKVDEDIMVEIRPVRVAGKGAGHPSGGR